MLKLSHILPPDAIDTASLEKLGENAPNDQCPRSIIGAIPPSAPLYLAIAHQLGSKAYNCYGKHQEKGIDDFSVLKTARDRSQTETRPSKSILIIASERSKWHESLVLENSSWLQEHGGSPRIAEALGRTDIKYCNSPKDALVLLTLLHLPSDPSPTTGRDTDASTLSDGIPSLIITWDMLNLFLMPGEDENGGYPAEREDEVQEKGICGSDTNAPGGTFPTTTRLREDTSAQEYLSLIAALRQTVDQLGALTTGCKPEYIVLEPQMTSKMEVPVPYSAQSQPVTHQKPQQTLGMAKGLYWLLVPGYGDVDGSRPTVLNITSDPQAADKLGSTSPQAEPQRFEVKNLPGDNIALFDRWQNNDTVSRPWLDHEGYTYHWVRHPDMVM